MTCVPWDWTGEIGTAVVEPTENCAHLFFLESSLYSVDLLGVFVMRFSDGPHRLSAKTNAELEVDPKNVLPVLDEFL